MNNIEIKEKLQKEAEICHINSGYKSTICASVGSGKSKIAINRIHEHFTKNKNSKIIFTGARDIYIETFKKELEVFNFKEYIPKIVFCCVASVKNYVNIDWNLIIVDECHIDSERIYSFIERYKKKKTEILLLTGTPRRDEIGRLLETVCPISFYKTIDGAINDTLINNYQITIIYHNLDNEDSYIPYGNIGFQTEYKKYNFLYKIYIESKSRKRKKFPYELMLLKTFFKNLRSKKQIADKIIPKIKGKTLIYAGSIEQSETFNFPTYHSNLSKEERRQNLDDFKKSENGILINVAGIRESANIPGLKYGFILAPDASENSFEQCVGRFSRLVIGETAHIYVLCAKSTIEEVWVNNAVKRLDKTKVNKINIEEIENLH